MLHLTQSSKCLSKIKLLLQLYQVYWDTWSQTWYLVKEKQFSWTLSHRATYGVMCCSCMKCNKVEIYGALTANQAPLYLIFYLCCPI